MAHDRHFQAVRSLGGDTNVHRPVPQDRVLLSVVMSVALRKGLQNPNEPRHHERQIGQARRPGSQLAIEVRAQ